MGENILTAARAHGREKGPAVEAAVTLFPVLREMWRGSAASCPAASSSSWRSPARW